MRRCALVPNKHYTVLGLDYSLSISLNKKKTNEEVRENKHEQYYKSNMLCKKDCEQVALLNANNASIPAHQHAQIPTYIFLQLERIRKLFRVVRVPVFRVVGFGFSLCIFEYECNAMHACM